MVSNALLLKQIASKGLFTRKEMEALTGSAPRATWHIARLLKEGNIERIRRDYYAVIDPATGASISNRFQIASRICEDSCISHHSAFEYYGCANQVYVEVYYTAPKIISSFNFGHMTYTWVGKNIYGFVEESYDGVRVTSLERTVIDSIADCDKLYGSGIEETVKCILAAPLLREDAILKVLATFDKGSIYQKAGYLFETFQDDLQFSDSLIDECERHISNSRKYLTTEAVDNSYHPRWKLYAPDLKKIISKGVDLDADY